eukprot:XP_011453724.1 PREDICTED: protein jagged-1 [Crassostrea gigas]
MKLFYCSLVPLLMWISFVQITKGKITFFIEVSEIKNNGSRIYGGGCCQGINGSQCSVLCKPLLTISLRNQSGRRYDSLTTNVNMRKEDVILGSRIGNSSNPIVLEANSWDKLWDQIQVEVRDFRYYVQPLIFEDSFHDFNLQTGDNILSQNWRQRRLTSQFNSSNDFSITLTYKAYCSEGYYGIDCSGHCPGNPRKCVVNGTTYCKTGWFGADCNKDINECATPKFCNHGICTNTAGSFHCTCPPSFYGLRCQLDEDECLLNPCNGEECINKIGSYECVCGNSTTGTNCERLVASNCTNKTCHHHGTCNNQTGEAICNCSSEYSGTACATVNHCFKRNCSANGVCINGIDGHVCSCSYGYTGNDCEHTYCYRNQCRNGATCVTGNSDYACICSPGYTGNYCETRDHCFLHSQNCSGHGFCINGPYNYTCICDWGSHGSECEIFKFDLNVTTILPENTPDTSWTTKPICTLSSCNNHGKCYLENNSKGYLCDCEEDWSGSECERFDYCHNVVCSNYGECFTGLADFFCMCEKDHFGKLCNVTHFCKNINCSSPRICKEHLDGYSCECPDGLFGAYCERV